MKHKIFTLTLLVTIIGTFSSCNTEIDYQKEEEKVKKHWKETTSFAQSGDWENYDKCWSHAPNLQVLHPDSREWIKGWDEFASIYEKRLELLSTATMHKNDITVNVSKSGDMAWGIADVIFSLNASAKIHMWETIIFEKTEGKWKIVSVMASTVPELKNE